MLISYKIIILLSSQEKSRQNVVMYITFLLKKIWFIGCLTLRIMFILIANLKRIIEFSKKIGIYYECT